MMTTKKKRSVSKRINRNMNLSAKFIFGDEELKKLKKKRKR